MTPIQNEMDTLRQITMMATYAAIGQNESLYLRTKQKFTEVYQKVENESKEEWKFLVQFFDNNQKLSHIRALLGKALQFSINSLEKEAVSDVLEFCQE